MPYQIQLTHTVLQDLSYLYRRNLISFQIIYTLHNGGHQVAQYYLHETVSEYLLVRMCLDKAGI